MKKFNLALLGFGNVGRALAGLLLTQKDEPREKYGIEYRVTGIAARRLGRVSDPNGLDLKAALAGHLPTAPAWEQSNIHDWLRAAQADVLLENTSLNPQTGQPAIDSLKAALEHGAHVVTANRGPVVHAYHELQALARAKGKWFLHEAAVMGGAPVFSLFREALPAANLKRFRGILNSTTNLILTEMERGLSFDEAVKKAQELGIAETDPSADVDGWDAAVKVAALATVLMDAPVTPQAVNPTGIRALTGEQVWAARAAGRPFKLVCRAKKVNGAVRASVGPQQVEAGDPRANTSTAPAPSSSPSWTRSTDRRSARSTRTPSPLPTAHRRISLRLRVLKAKRIPVFRIPLRLTQYMIRNTHR
ncbi:MAG: homoserine dehydrogenase [Anaerolineales bacterium]|nr:homoserine dehydrogenase [Anaerolineales bacterium]